MSGPGRSHGAVVVVAATVVEDVVGSAVTVVTVVATVELVVGAGSPTVVGGIVGPVVGPAVDPDGAGPVGGGPVVVDGGLTVVGGWLNRGDVCELGGAPPAGIGTTPPLTTICRAISAPAAVNHAIASR